MLSSLLVGFEVSSSSLPGVCLLKPMLVLGLEGGGILSFSSALDSVDSEEPEVEAMGLPESVEKVRDTLVTIQLISMAML